MAKKTATKTPKTLTAAEARTEALKTTEFNLTYVINNDLVDSARQCGGVDENGETIYIGPARLADFVARLNSICYRKDVDVNFAHKLNGTTQVVVVTTNGKVTELECKGVSDFVEQMTSFHQDIVVRVLVRTGTNVFVPVIPTVNIVEEG